MTFVYNTDEDTNHEMRILKMMRMQRVAGLILISTRSDVRHGRRLLAGDPCSDRAYGQPGRWHAI